MPILMSLPSTARSRLVLCCEMISKHQHASCLNVGRLLSSEGALVGRHRRPFVPLRGAAGSAPAAVGCPRFSLTWTSTGLLSFSYNPQQPVRMLRRPASLALPLELRLLSSLQPSRRSVSMLRPGIRRPLVLPVVGSQESLGARRVVPVGPPVGLRAFHATSRRDVPAPLALLALLKVRSWQTCLVDEPHES